MPQQKRADVLALAPVILDRHRPRAHQVANRLVRLVRDPYRRQLAGPQEASQRLRIPPVRLHPVARPTRDQRGRDNGAVLPQGADLPIQPISGRTGFITEMHRLIVLAQVADNLATASAVLSISPR
jgi:hypothetical protein